MLRIDGGRKLYGEIRISGAKNAALPLMAAAILTKEEVILHECPMISDVEDMKEILRELGAEVERTGHTMRIHAEELSETMPEELSHKIRSSIFLLGSVLARKKEARFYLPGGCEIGRRPIDQHLRALNCLGAEIEADEGMLLCRTKGLRGCEIRLDFPSVGATENAMLAGAAAEGVTILRGAAREPEIVCLAELLNRMGAEVHGAGSSVLYICGKPRLHGAEFTCIPDRIEAGTYLAAAAATGGELTLRQVMPGHLEGVTELLRGSGAQIKAYSDALLLKSTGRLAGFSVTTQPYPGFPTDLQPQFGALACFCGGTSYFTETVFENRLRHLDALEKAGAEILRTSPCSAEIRGASQMQPMDYYAQDLRGGAAFLIAALATEGQSRIFGTHYLNRGYENPEGKLRGVGAEIIRV